MASSFTCKLCVKTFSRNYHLRRHYRNCHNGYSLSETSHSSPSLKCAICSTTTCNKFSVFSNHLSNQHGIVLDTVNIDFQNLNEFEKWKKTVEEETYSVFIKNRGNARLVNDSVTSIAYYQCNRSGNYRGMSISSTKRKRSIKSQGSSKINAYCPARIKAIFKSDGKVNVSFCKTHVGHYAELAHIPLANDEKKVIASKIAEQIPFDTILAGIQGSVSGEIKRKHILTKKDLHNIKKEYSLHSQWVRHSDDILSIEAWVDQQVQARDMSYCILLYKPNGVESPDYPQLKSEDFLLGIMTDVQAEMLNKYGCDCICIDSTLGTDAYKFEMTTLLVLDDMYQGFPCAFYFSNRNDHIGVDIFLKSIRDSIGIVKTKVLMTDMTSVFYHSWKCIMGDGEKRLFCMWHVQSAWQKKINQIKNYIKKKETSKKIFSLHYEVDDKAFEFILPVIVDELSADSDTAEFGKYFQENYVANRKSWAYCYRKSAGIDTYMHFERLHGIFTHLYSKGKLAKRLDITVHALVRFFNHKLFNSRVVLHKMKLTSKVSNIIKDRHKRSLSLQIENVRQLEIDCWAVYSVLTTGLINVYTVTINKTSCNCLLICEHCKTCFHKFNCTCTDACIQGNMCKHIHLVCKTQTLHPTKEDANESHKEVVRGIEHDLDTSNLTVKENENVYEEGVVLPAVGRQFHNTDLDSMKQKVSDNLSLILNKIQSVEQLEIIRKGLQYIESQINTTAVEANRSENVTDLQRKFKRRKPYKNLSVKPNQSENDVTNNIVISTLMNNPYKPHDHTYI